ncbi:transporter substrate-binding domain-containing protein [uncultured Pseudodesulfovibrio sp.]|uniref:substrate-binding periplasmic protein n=1 Tax=uncultured Pseudodesulfovibrio sp. TaxID=2035858 RepID=UPI0029C71767|nr:transporter substrate-binding domain-containing protein [uncultured Pseudodesulfovibrio sp.]
MPRRLDFAFFAFILFILTFFTTAAFAEPPLRVAVEDHYPPYSFKNEKGEMDGFNVDIAKALAASMGVRCEIVSVAWDDMLPRLSAGDYDAIVACMAVKPERLEFADFTDYYLRSKTGFIGRKEMSNDTSAAAMTGKTLVSQEGTAQLAYLKKVYGKVATVRGYPSMEEGFLAVAEERADLCLTPLLAGLEFLKSDKGQHCDIIGPALTETQFTYAPAHIAVKKGNKALLIALNNALRSIRANGEYSIISRKYFPFSVY